MASHNSAVFQNENLPLHRGKGVDGLNPDVLKPARTARQERKALRDVSNTGKPLASVASKGSALKEKSAAHRREAAKNSSKSSFMTDEEIRKCHEWAKEGIEQVHFTGNDLQKVQRDRNEQCRRKKVEKVMSALNGWSNMAYNLGSLKQLSFSRLLVQEVARDAEDLTRMDLEMEVLPPLANLCSTSDEKEILDDLSGSELDRFPYVDGTFELKLKEDYDLVAEMSPTMTSLL